MKITACLARNIIFVVKMFLVHSVTKCTACSALVTHDLCLVGVFVKIVASVARHVVEERDDLTQRESQEHISAKLQATSCREDRGRISSVYNSLTPTILYCIWIH